MNTTHNTSPRTIAISISKGGTGKTTTAVNLAAGLAALGRRVLLIDTDTQGHAALMLGVAPTHGLKELVLGEVSFDPYPARPNLHLLGGGQALATLKQHIARQEFRGELTLAEALTPVITNYDFVLVDTSPGWDLLNANVFFFVEEILAPVSTEVLTLKSMVDFLSLVTRIQKYKPLTLKYVVPTYLDKRVKKSSEVLTQITKFFPPETVCPTIRYNVKLSEAPGHGQTIFEYDPHCNGAQDYLALTRRIADGT